MADPLARLRRFLRELKRRNVYKVAVAYVAVAFVGLQAARLLEGRGIFGWPQSLARAPALLLRRRTRRVSG